MERRSICLKTNFCKPLFVYKVIYDKAYEYCLKIIAYMFGTQCLKTVYVEDLQYFTPECFQKISDNISRIDFGRIEKFDLNISTPDLVIVIGGDGTTLWANDLFGSKERPPFLTFNLGTLGYMAIYNCEDYQEVLQELLNLHEDLIKLEKRSTLSCKIKNRDQIASETSNLQEVQNGGCGNCISNIINDVQYWEVDACELFALNDVVIERSDSLQCVNLQIYVNKEPLTTVRCDGLIFSTSTGSTAYSLSAGGPIIHYDMDALILNAICPHSLSFRPIIFCKNMTIEVVVAGGSKGVVLYHDGVNRLILKPNQGIEVSLSDIYVNFIVLEKFVKNRTSLWKTKMTDQLGWNNSFKNN